MRSPPNIEMSEIHWVDCSINHELPRVCESVECSLKRQRPRTRSAGVGQHILLVEVPYRGSHTQGSDSVRKARSYKTLDSQLPSAVHPMSPSFSGTPPPQTGSPGSSSPSPHATPKNKNTPLPTQPQAPPLSSSPSSVSSSSSNGTATPGDKDPSPPDLGLASVPLPRAKRAKSPLRALFTPKQALRNLPGPSLTSSPSNYAAPGIEHSLSHDSGVAAILATDVHHEHHENHKHKSLPTDDEMESNASLANSRATLAVPAKGVWGEGDASDDEMPSTFRDRSRSPSRARIGIVDDSNTNGNGNDAENGEHHHLGASWWGPSDKKKKGVKKSGTSEEQAAVNETRKKVARAVVSVLGTSAEIAHELLSLAVEFSNFVPVPGLAVAAQTLLNIWDASQEVDMNTNGCLRLTERCADNLYTIREEVARAGDTLGESLRQPIEKLEESFTFVLTFVLQQSKRPWLKRYLRRDEIPREIADCDSRLRDALALFGISIQIRILEQVRASEIMRENETRVLAIEALRNRDPKKRGISITGEGSFTEVFSPEPAQAFPPISYYPETPPAGTSNALGLIDDDQLISPLDLPSPSAHYDDDTPDALKTKAAVEKEIEAQAQARVTAQLAGIHSAQNAADAARDSSALRTLLRSALQTSTDAAILDVLQIARDEMPDAIKALQRALEGLVERESISGENLSNSAALTSTGDPTWPGSAGTGQFNLPSGAKTATSKKATLPHEVLAVGPGGIVVQRAETFVSMASSSTESSSLTGSIHHHRRDLRRRDTLDFEFIEMGIDCMRRLSRGTETTVPNWTITKYEVDRQDKIGYGFFSDVYKGRWQNKIVAIKVLAPTTPRNLFVREMGIWKTLRHPNVLSLYGASSACGPTPWFFVSPYLQYGTLVEYLRHVELDIRPRGLGIGAGSNDLAGTITPRANSPAVRASTLPNSSPMFVTGKSPKRGGGIRHPLLAPTPAYLSPPVATGSLPGSSPMSLHNELSDPVEREWDLFRFMHEIAKGMSYLHANGVHHGDLKASNVLVGDKFRCVISDFGQSEMKSEAFRTTGIPPSKGTLRWQAPEFMAGRSELTPAVDVWAFSITCVEILTMGRLPWKNHDDTAVRHFVLHDNTRPPVPRSRFNIPGLQKLLQNCWDTDPDRRPDFKTIARSMKQIRRGVGESPDASPYLSPKELDHAPPASPSPDMRPKDLPAFLAGVDGHTLPPDVFVGALLSDAIGSSLRRVEPERPHRESTVGSGIKFPEPVIYTPATSRKSSMHLIERQEPEPISPPPDDGYESPAPIDKKAADAKNERRYRLLLTHNFHPSLTLPLWDPSPVEVGAVGYLSKPEGRFITLFNALRPREETEHPKIGTIGSIEGFGSVALGEQRLPKKTVFQGALDIIIGSLTFRNTTSESVARRFPFPLKAGHKVAHLYTEITDYKYVETLDAPKLWFRNNVDLIMQIYGPEHRITREELFLIIGTLNTPAWALMVSHRHPEGHAHFNVYSNPRPGQPWGMFTTDTEVAQGLGPSYEGEEMNDLMRINASKVSRHCIDPWDSILLARLRFKPDAVDPTSK
ncbi:hypothetical protein D9619_009450 [Psilocybe cf. subviscida]|uniref:Protein kinase domain-containing protein n=1 Tax=Psilocybe cf. subviscida TaxID=2480587 RepID=A0A8H5BTP2_9AGAR|nr:hypothetical protein D9619_009450 [Psilocybe cf. subviscida]